jgi:hypothetical protein
LEDLFLIEKSPTTEPHLEHLGADADILFDAA